MATGSTSALERTCTISGPGAVSEALGIAFLKLGDKAQVIANELKAKKRINSIFNYNSYSGKGVSFKMAPSDVNFPGIIQKIPFEEIGRVVSFTISIYFYGKLIITCYKYGQRLLTQFKNKQFKNRGLIPD